MIVYGLQDPRNGELRYVGKTRRGTIEERFREHNACAKCPRLHVHCWMKNVIDSGFAPEIFLIEDGYETIEQLNDAEIFWIAYFRSIGCRLTNQTSGGDGGWFFSEETLKRMSDLQKGRKLSESCRKKISSALLGKKRSAETRAKISAAARNRSPELIAQQIARLNTPESRAKNAVHSRNLSLETIEKIRRTNTGKKRSAETRAKISAVVRNISDDTRRKMSESHRGPRKKRDEKDNL